MTSISNHSCVDRNEASPAEETEFTVEPSIMVNSDGWIEEQVVSLSYLKKIFLKVSQLYHKIDLIS